MIQKHYIIKGKVQGVGFRYYTQQKAISLNIKGWVQNLKNGDVECLAIANSNELDLFEKELYKGPTFSNVISIQSTIQKESHFTDFSILK